MNNSDTPHQAATLTIDQALQQAIAHHQAGKLQEAEQLYRAILQTQPNHPDANHNLGVLALQVKQPAAAVPHFKLALEFNPNQGQYWLSYIDALILTGQTNAARMAIEQGIQQGMKGIETLPERFKDEPQGETQNKSDSLDTASLKSNKKKSKHKWGKPEKSTAKNSYRNIIERNYWGQAFKMAS